MNKEERALVLPITFGSMFEWYEVFLYVYWSPIIADAFFELSFPLAELIQVILILSVGLIARPVGGMLFGYIGDRWGRRVSFLISIICITIPSIGVALMPTFSSWAYSTIIYLGLMRFLQGIPAGGELPGALCLLAEGAKPERMRYLCSFLFVGPQIGQIISITQCLLLEKYLTSEQLLDWGWRLSFWIGGVIGLIGFFLRKKLHESIPFEKLKAEHKIEYHPLRESIKNYKKNIVIGLLISLFEVMGFFVIYFYLLENSSTILKVSESNNLLTNIIFLSSITLIMPIIGYVGDKYKNKPMFKLSALGVSVLSIPFYFAITNSSQFWMFLLLSLIILLFCIQFSLLPSLIANLFPVTVRFTCIGFSFNVADGVIGGIIPYLGGFLGQATGKQAAFIILLPFTAAIFLFSMKFLKKLHPPLKNI